MDEDFKKLCAIIADVLGIDPGEITMDTTFDDDLGADSLDVVELNLALEEACGATIADEDLQNIKTVQDIVDYLESHK